MEEAKEPSFGRLVLGKAYSKTKSVFADKVKDALWGVLLVVVGGVFSWQWHGWPIAMQGAFYFVLTTFGPIGIVVVVVFLWNLWLSPAELAYEAWQTTLANSQSTSLTSQIKPQRAVDWTPWRRMSKFSLKDFAKILATDDPALPPESPKAVAYTQLIGDAAAEKQFPYILRKRTDFYGKLSTEPLCADSEVLRADAITWAKSLDFDVSHIE